MCKLYKKIHLIHNKMLKARNNPSFSLSIKLTISFIAVDTCKYLVSLSFSCNILVDSKKEIINVHSNS